MKKVDGLSALAEMIERIKYNLVDNRSKGVTRDTPTQGINIQTTGSTDYSRLHNFLYTTPN